MSLFSDEIRFDIAIIWILISSIVIVILLCITSYILQNIQRNRHSSCKSSKTSTPKNKSIFRQKSFNINRFKNALNVSIESVFVETEVHKIGDRRTDEKILKFSMVTNLTDLPEFTDIFEELTEEVV